MEVRLEEAPEARLAGRLPGKRLIQWSHREELVEPAETDQNVRLRLHSHRIQMQTVCHVGAVAVLTQIYCDETTLQELPRIPTGDRAVGRPGGDDGPPLVEQYVGRLLAHVVVGYWGNLAVIEAVPLTVDGVLAVG